MNATTATQTLAVVGGLYPNTESKALANRLSWCASAARLVGWATAGLISAIASYIFGLGAVVLGVLGQLQLEAGWWPTILCLILGYFSARGSVACIELAFTPNSREGGS
ncbi:MAG TPA: hypothetical protein VFG14_14030 [Chthoniobacteraceae bacterium]|nr:hypothetical protein [Chthoniobacteraceae bacterium]